MHVSWGNRAVRHGAAQDREHMSRGSRKSTVDRFSWRVRSPRCPASSSWTHPYSWTHRCQFRGHTTVPIRRSWVLQLAHGMSHTTSSSESNFCIRYLFHPTRHARAPTDRHDGALDCHVMTCSVLAPRYEAFNLSSQDYLPTNARGQELYLHEHVNRHRHTPPPPSCTLHHRHNGALDRHVMSCGASAPRFEASTSLLPSYPSSENHQQTRSEELHLDEHVNNSHLSRAAVRSKPKARDRQCSGP